MPKTMRGWLLQVLRERVARAEQRVLGCAVAAHASGWDMGAADTLDKAVRHLVKVRRDLERERAQGGR